MKITQQGSATKVVLTDKAGKGAKTFLAAQILVFGCFVGVGIALIVRGLTIANYEMALIGAVPAAVFSAIVARLAIRITKRASLLLEENSFIIVRHTLGRKQVKEYQYNGMANLCYIGVNGPSPAQSLNTWAASQQANTMVDEGDIAFFYEGRQVRFGVGLSSWEVEELSTLLAEKTLGALTIAGLPEAIPDEYWQVA